MIVLGIDPGISGALAFFNEDIPDRVEAFDLPVVAGVIDGRNLALLIKRHAPTKVIIEDVHSMPKQGVASTFKFGRAFGTAIGIVEGLGIPVTYVSPAKWKRHFNLDSDGEKSRRMALNTFPQTASLFARKKDHNRAEAALIALYGSSFKDREDNRFESQSQQNEVAA